MRIKYFFTFTVVFLFAGLPLQAQPAEAYCMVHGRNEIGFGVSGAYEFGHRTWTPSLHLHYFRTFTLNSRWAFGGGIEYLSGNEKHFEIGLGVRFEPVSHLHLTLLPGIMLTDRPHFSLHVEATYPLLHIGQFHMGPAVGYGWSRGHSHGSVGVHAAVSF